MARTGLVQRSKQASYRLGRGSVVTSGFASNHQIQLDGSREAVRAGPWPAGARPWTGTGPSRQKVSNCQHWRRPYSSRVHLVGARRSAGGTANNRPVLPR